MGRSGLLGIFPLSTGPKGRKIPAQGIGHERPMPWVSFEERPAPWKGARVGRKQRSLRSCRDKRWFSGSLSGRFGLLGVFPGRRPCGLGPGLESAGPLGRFPRRPIIKGPRFCKSV